METISDIFDRFGGVAATAAVLSVKVSTASEMKRRASIPVKYWPALIAEAKYRRIKLTNDMLAIMHVSSPPRPTPIFAEDAGQ